MASLRPTGPKDEEAWMLVWLLVVDASSTTSRDKEECSAVVTEAAASKVTVGSCLVSGEGWGSEVTFRVEVLVSV